jgi:hypothetical protein
MKVERSRRRAAVAALAFLLAVAPASSQQAQVRHWSGQGVAPAYEGFDINPDGSFNLWFGYMNRNYEEELDIPVGPDNNFEPGGDRGQPTHFTVRRHKDVFRVMVPKDFGDQKLVWTLNAHGQTAQVAATLNPVWQIDRLHTTRGGNSENISSNTPPMVTVQPAELTLPNPGSVTFNLSATDDGLPKVDGKSIGMTVLWSKYRGPGPVSFNATSAKLADGKAATIANFSESGEYVLQAVVDDGSGESAGNFGYHCCWTNVQVRVIVNKKSEVR